MTGDRWAIRVYSPCIDDTVMSGWIDRNGAEVPDRASRYEWGDKPLALKALRACRRSDYQCFALVRIPAVPTLADHQAILRRVYSDLGEVLAQPSPLEKLMAKKPKPKPKPKPGC